jgi:hypothetical protein
LLYWYKSTNTDAARRSSVSVLASGTSCTAVFLLYWYKSTNTDAARRSSVSVLASGTSCTAEVVAAASQLNAPASVLAAQIAGIKVCLLLTYADVCGMLMDSLY